jgi:imidazolonepropionase-like amidohydrolase
MVTATGTLRRLSVLAVAVLAVQPVQADVLFENITLIDGTGTPPQPGMFVLVTGERIDRISSEPIPAPGRVPRINGTDHYLLPGLFDVHIHVPRGEPNTQIPGGFTRKPGLASLHSFLYSGITSVYDAGNNADYSLTLRAEEREGRLLSPRIFATGAGVSFPGSWGASPAAVVIQRWPEDAAGLAANFARQPDLQKITYENFGAGANAWVPSFPPQLVTRIIHYAQGEGVRTTVHISDESHARVVLAAGADTLAHPVTVGRMSDEFLQAVVDSGVITASTLAVFDNIVRIVEDPSFLDQPEFRAVIEAEEIQRLKTSGRQRYGAIGWGTWFKTILPFAQENLRRIHEAGGLIALGTDRHFGPLAHREMELLVEAGMTPLDVLTIATLNAARYLGVENELGSVAVGKLADLVLVDADPSTDIRNAARIVRVFKGGVPIDRAALHLPVNQ